MPPNTLLNFSPRMNKLPETAPDTLRLTLDESQATYQLQRSQHADAIAEHLYEATKLPTQPHWKDVPQVDREPHRRKALFLINREHRVADSIARAAGLECLHRYFLRGHMGCSSVQCEVIDAVLLEYTQVLEKFVGGVHV